jgi:hypothetical protein
MSTCNWDHAQQHMECTIYFEEEEELGRSRESTSDNS